MPEGAHSVESLSSGLLLPGWATVTTRLLGAAGSQAWNYWDDAFESDFAPRLNQELEATGLWSRLRPARTKGDVQVADIANILAQQTAGLSGLEANEFPTQRGDKNVFVDRTYRLQPSFTVKHEYLARLIKRVETTAVHHMQDCMAFDLSLTSVQLAEYPGDSEAGYPIHCDRDEAICRQNDRADPAPTGSTEPQRLLTVLYYLTPDDWSVDTDGGCLRLQKSTSGYTDVAPYANRIVVFRSDGVLHQVLPSMRRPRRAVTIWLYGTLRRPLPLSVSGTQVANKVHSAQDRPPESKLDLPPPLPVQLEASEATSATVFVSIAAFRDSETGPTLKNLMETAHTPERIFVGLVLQLDMNESYDCQVWDALPRDQPWFVRRVRTLKLDARHASGPCPARALSQGLYRGEDYILMIDSHMRFRKNWDVYLIEELKRCPSSKPMLTTYPTGYHLPNEIPNETRGTRLFPWKFDQDGLLRIFGRFFQEQPTEPVLHRWYAAGFSFGPGSIVMECPYDGSLHHLFFGEELSMAARLHSAGYDLYAPCQSVCYHLWSRSHRPSPLPSTFDTRSKAEWRKQSINAVLSQEELQGFGDSVGVNFSTRTIVNLNANDTGGRIGADEMEVQLTSDAKRTILSFL